MKSNIILACLMCGPSLALAGTWVSNSWPATNYPWQGTHAYTNAYTTNDFPDAHADYEPGILAPLTNSPLLTNGTTLYSAWSWGVQVHSALVERVDVSGFSPIGQNPPRWWWEDTLVLNTNNPSSSYAYGLKGELHYQFASGIWIDEGLLSNGLAGWFASGTDAPPTYSESSILTSLGIRTDFWDRTPWWAETTNSGSGTNLTVYTGLTVQQDWDNMYHMINTMRWSYIDTSAWQGSGQYADGYSTNWQQAKDNAEADESGGAPFFSPCEYSYGSSSATDDFSASYEMAGGYATASHPCTNMTPHVTAWAWAYPYPGDDAVWDANSERGTLSESQWSVIHSVSNVTTNAIQTTVIGTSNAQPTWCAEPETNTSPWRGYTCSKRVLWIFDWTGTNGFEYQDWR